jgi:hypothetical protein
MAKTTPVIVSTIKSSGTVKAALAARMMQHDGAASAQPIIEFAQTVSWEQPSHGSMSPFCRALPLLAALSCRDPRAEANIAQAMTEVGTTLALVQQDYALLQSEVDSLRQVVARQDTIITRLASMAGLPLQQR